VVAAAEAVSRRGESPESRRPGLLIRILLANLAVCAIVAGGTASAAEQVVTLRSVVNGNFVRAGVGNQSLLAAASRSAGDWERFALVELGDDQVALRSSKSGKYVRGGVGPQGMLAAVSGAVGTWERFQLVPLGEGRVALRSVQNGRYVRAGIGQSGYLAAVSSGIGDWERFELGRMPTALPLLPKLPPMDLKPMPSLGTLPAPDRQEGQDEALEMLPLREQAVPRGMLTRIDSWMASKLPRLGASMDRLSRAVEEARLKRSGGSRPSPQAMLQPPVETRDLLQDQLIAEQFQVARVDPDKLLSDEMRTQDIYLQPRIDKLIYVPVTDELQPGSYVIIRGQGFGQQGGRVILAYKTGSGELGKAKTLRQAELLPLHGSWQQAWLPHQVAARVPVNLPGGADLGGNINARLILVRANGATAEKTVALVPGTFPVVNAVKTDHGMTHCCCPVGTETWSQLPESHDFVYWRAPMAYYEGQTPCWLRKREWLVPGGTAVIHGERFGPGKPEVRVWLGEGNIASLRRIGATVTDWTPSTITIRMPGMAIKSYYQTRAAKLQVRTGRGDSNVRPMAFGPEMTSRWVSGRYWLEKSLHDNDEIVETKNRKAMIVAHVPTCGKLGSKEQNNEKGYDRFFEEPDAPFPDDVWITWVRFQQIDPADPADQWSFFADDVWEFVNLMGDPAGLIEFGLKNVVKGIVLSGEGGYHAYPPLPPPDPQAGPGESTSKGFHVRWETSCPVNDGKPIVYFISFLIEGSPEAVARY